MIYSAYIEYIVSRANVVDRAYVVNGKYIVNVYLCHNLNNVNAVNGRVNILLVQESR